MSLKKLSLAAALSIGIMTVGGIAKADQVTGAACPVCPPQKVQPYCPPPCPEPCDPCAPVGAACPCPQPVIQQVVCPCQPRAVQSPVCIPPVTTQPLSQNPIVTTIPNCAPNAKTLERQAYAFPSIGYSSVVIPQGDNIMQIGGQEEKVAYSATGGGLRQAPNCGALTLYPENTTGAACPISGQCPEQIKQGFGVGRCPSVEKNFWGFGDEDTPELQSFTTGACPATGCGLIGAAAPVNPCNPCQPCNPCDPCQSYPTGAACPVCPCDPCQPMVPVAPMGAACPIQPCNPCDPCNPCQPCNPCDPCQPTGAAAPLQGKPIRIQTSSGIEIQQQVMVPVMIDCPTGGAACPCPADPQFPDVSNNQLNGCDVNKLASQGILAGYPDRTYKPNLPIIRSEFASAMVSALELENVPDFQQQIFRDVSVQHWANADIDKAYNRGLMAGYPNDMFKPNEPVSRAEALATMAKMIPGEMDQCQAQQVLQSYLDGNEVPNWALTSVAEALNAGLICDVPNNVQIRPNASATRSEIASMLENLREQLALDPCPEPTGAAATLQPQIITTTIPTLKVKFEDIISARTGEIGDRFAAVTTETICIDGQFFPEGTKVRGEIVEVIRPGIGQDGAIRIKFNKIGEDGNSMILPNEVLSATVIKEDTPNIIGRLFAWPFTWPGKVAGVAGRTVGGVAIVAANTVEGFFTNIGNGNNELFNGKGMAAGRSYLTAVKDVGQGIFLAGTTTLSGIAGTLKETGDEVAYLVYPDGQRVAKIQPNEVVSIAFGCRQ